MSAQPEALRLADELERDKWHVPAVVMQAAADELRRLHAQRDALLEVLKKMRIKYGEYACSVCDQADAAIKAVEETKEPVQEPVAWMCSSPELMAKGYKRFSSRCEGDWNIPVYTAPPQRKPLTEEEIDKIFNHLCNTVGASCKTMARAIERAHGIKERK